MGDQIYVGWKKPWVGQRADFLSPKRVVQGDPYELSGAPFFLACMLASFMVMVNIPQR